jgi:expansin
MAAPCRRHADARYGRAILAAVLGRPVLFAACALAVLACGSDDVEEGSGGSTKVLSSELSSGVATYYDYSGASGVACSFDVTSDTDVTAMNDADFGQSASCGSCLNVSGPKGTVTVKIVDRCPGCDKNHIDLSEQAFAKIADPKAGRVPVTYQLVACSVKGNMSYHFKEGSSKYWTAIQVRDHRIPIEKVEYKKNGVYTDMPRSTYNYFIDTKGVGDQPTGITLRVTASDGQVVEETIGAVQDGKLIAGSAQFK